MEIHEDGAREQALRVVRESLELRVTHAIPPETNPEERFLVLHGDALLRWALRWEEVSARVLAARQAVQLRMVYAYSPDLTTTDSTAWEPRGEMALLVATYAVFGLVVEFRSKKTGPQEALAEIWVTN